MSTAYTPSAGDAKYSAFTGVSFNDPGTSPLSAHDPDFVSAKFFLKPIQDEVLYLIALGLEGDKGLSIYNDTGSTLAAGALVAITGYDDAQAAFTVTLADSNDDNTEGTFLFAEYVVNAEIINLATGEANRFATVGGLNTSAAEYVGQQIYLSETPGEWTITPPTNVQAVGRVLSIDASDGIIWFAPGLSAGGIDTSQFLSEVTLGSFDDAVDMGVIYGDADGSLTQLSTFIFKDSQPCLTIGASTPTSIYSVFETVKDGSVNIDRHISYDNTALGGHQMYSQRGRGSVASPSSVQDGDRLGIWYFRGYNTGDATFKTAAAIGVHCDGAHSAGSSPGKLSVFTTPDGSTSLYNRTEWRENGDIIHMGNTQFGVNLGDPEDDDDIGLKLTFDSAASMFEAGSDQAGYDTYLNAQSADSGSGYDLDGGSIVIKPGSPAGGGDYGFFKVECAYSSEAMSFQHDGNDAYIYSGLGTAEGDLVLVADKVQFGTHSSIGAETVTGYITIKTDDGFERKVAIVS